ncbi:putative prolyl 4-hydroxylase 9 [Diplonema papillatum]|nr:putative prolyl 4-hydroxylase 9 [Diplonema papillatum]|eukprot:gene11572-17824_t
MPPFGKQSKRPTSKKVWYIVSFALAWVVVLGRQHLSTASSASIQIIKEKLRYAPPERAYANHREEYLERGELSKPVLPESPVTTMQWNGVEVPIESEWDFFGLKVPTTPALSRAKEGQVRTDYDIASINASAVPRGYEYPATPAYRYPPTLDRLFATVSTQPRVLFFPQILTEDEIDEILRQASSRLQRSQVALTKDKLGKSGASATQEARTSHSTWVNLDGKLDGLNKRLSTIVGTTWHEPLNVLRYEIGQHYDSHHDYFDPKYYGSQVNNRMATFFLYMSDTEEGGATTIPRANNGKHPVNYKEAACHQGIQVFPRRGAGVLFYDMRPDKSLDPLSLHGACDVEKGTKWGGPVWFRASTPSGTGQSHD